MSDRRIKDIEVYNSVNANKDYDDDFSIFMEHRQESIANIERFKPSNYNSSNVVKDNIQLTPSHLTIEKKEKKKRPTKRELFLYKEKKKEKITKKESWLHED